jgi:hypothetical protein
MSDLMGPNDTISKNNQTALQAQHHKQMMKGQDAMVAGMEAAKQMTGEGAGAMAHHGRDATKKRLAAAGAANVK